MTGGIALGSRTLIADLDSYQQRLLVERVGLHEAWLQLRAQLRVADLLSDELLITDTQLLDGILLLRTGPAGVADLLGLSPDEALPLVVVARDPDLGVALEILTSDPTFLWSSSAAASFSRDHGVEVSEEDLVRMRQAWVDLARAGLIQVQPFVSEFSMVDSWQGAGPPPASLSDDLVASLRATSKRSKAFRILEDAGLDRTAVEDARWWWQEIYSAALARQHQATWLSFSVQSSWSSAISSDRPRGFRGGRIADITPVLSSLVPVVVGLLHRRRRPGPTSLALPISGNITATMAELPGSIFALIRHRSRTAQQEWIRRRDRWSLRSIAMVVRETTADAGTWSSRYRNLLARAVVLMLAVALTFATAVLPVASGFVAAPLVVALLAGVPYAELRALAEYSPAKLGGVIHLPTEPNRGKRAS